MRAKAIKLGSWEKHPTHCKDLNVNVWHTAVSRKVVQLKSIKAYATIPKGMMGCGCSLLHRQVHEAVL